MKRRKTKAEKLAKIKVQNAVYGFRIPMMEIPALYRTLEAAATMEATPEEMRAIVAAHPGVEKAS